MPPENPKTKINSQKKTKATLKWVVLGLFVIFGISIFVDISRAATGINKQINYQGKLTDGSGVSVADGNYNFKISLYTVSTGGTPVWTARGTVGTPTARSVAIANGIFSIMLGDTVAGDNALTLDFSQDAYYLGITVGSDAEMTSRKRIGSVPQAYNSNNLIGDGFVKITGVPTGSTVDTGTVYINPASATSGYTLLGLAVNGTQKFKVDEAGNVSSTGTINGQTISSSANFTGTLAFATLGTTNTSTLLCRNSSNQLAACNTIGVTQGGTGTTTQFTQGSVVFAGASGVYSQDNANFFWNSASARLGLGTATPSYLLDVSKSTNDYLARIYNTNTGSSAGGLSIRTDGTGNLLNLNANGTDVVTISETSSIFNNPTSFTAVGDVSMAYDLLMTNNSSSSIKSNGPLTVEVGEVFESNDLTLRTFNSGQVVLDSPGGLVSSQAQTWILATGASALNFVNAGGTSILNLDATNGRVGIGITTPTGALHLKAGTATAGTAPIKLTAGTNLSIVEAGAIEWDGTNLFITQTSGPTRKTIAYTTDLSGGYVPYTGATGNLNLGVYSLISPTIIGGSSTTASLILQTTTGVGTTGADMHFRVGNAGGTEAMTILNSGNVGIGTTSPSALLHIGGDNTNAGLKVVGSYIDLPTGQKMSSSMIANDLMFYLPMQNSLSSSRGNLDYFTRTDSTSGSSATYTMDAGWITSSSVYNNGPRFEKTNIGKGVWVENGRRNLFQYQSFEDGGSITGWTNSGLETFTTTTSYLKNGGYSATLGDTNASGGQAYRAMTLTSGQSYPFFCYALDTTSGALHSAVDSSKVQLYAGSAISTTYTPVEGDWYKISGTVTGTGGSVNYGVDVKASKQIQLDGCQIEADYNTTNGVPYATTMIYNDSTNQRNRGEESLYYYVWRGNGGYISADSLLDPTRGTVSFWWRPEWAYNNPTADLYLMQVPNVIQVFYSYADDKVYAQMYNGTNWTTVAVSSSAQTFGALTDHYVSVRWDATSGLILNLDGTEYTQSVTWTAQTQQITTSTVLYVGSKSSAGGRADSLLSDFATFDRSLTKAEVMQIYNNKAPIEDYQRSDIVMLQQSNRTYQSGSIRVSGEVYGGSVSTGTVSTTYLSSGYLGLKNASNFSSHLAMHLPFEGTVDGSRKEVGTFSRADATSGAAVTFDESVYELVSKNANEPRIERGLDSNNYTYDTGNKNGNFGITIEESRKNIVLNSSFETTPSEWTAGSGCAVSQATSLEIHGAYSGNMTSTSACRVTQTVDLSTVTAGTRHQISAYVFRNETSNWGMTIDNTIASLYARTDDGLTALSTTYAPLGNGWYRLTSEFDSTAANNWDVGVYLPSASRNVLVDSIQVERSASNGSVYFPTTYIPTGASETTRAGESLAYAVPAGYKSQKGGFSFWFKPQWTRAITSDATDKYLLYIPNELRVRLDATNDRFSIDHWDGSAWVTTATTSTTDVTRYGWNHLACGWYANYNRCYINGTSYTSGTSWTPQNPAGKTLYIGSSDTGTNQANAQLSGLAIFDTYLAPEQQMQLYYNRGNFEDYYRSDKVRLVDSTSTSIQDGSLFLGGVLGAGSGTLALPGFNFSSDRNTGIYNPATDQLGLVTGGTERIRIDSSGNVGIGTTSPTAVLHLKAGTATAGTAPLKFTSGTNLTAAEAGAMEWDGTNLFITQTSGPTRKTIAYTSDLTGGYVPYTGATANLNLGTYSLISPTIIGGSSTTASLTLQTTSGVGTTGADMHFKVGNNGGTEAMTILNNGNVGIGTTSPSQRLEVNGDIKIGSTVAEPHLIFSRAGYNYIQAPSSGALAFLVNGEAASDANSILVLRETGVSYFNKGNVGIGTTSPATKLHVSDGNTPNAALITSLGTSTITSTKQAGIGAISAMVASNSATERAPFVMVRARGTLATPTAVQVNDYLGDLLFGGYDGTVVNYGGGVFAFVDDTVSSGHIPTRLSFVTGTNSTDRLERLTIKNTGNVGIGTTSPDQLLVLDGTTAFPSASTILKINSASGRASMLMFTSGGLYSTSFGLAGTANQYFTGTAAGDYVIRAADNQKLYLGVDNGAGNNTPAVSILETGNVGIGTTAPLMKTEIMGDANTATPSPVLMLARPFNSGVARGSTAGFYLSNPATGTGNNTRLDINLLAANTVSDTLPDTTVMTLLSNGNVGIGTTTPGGPLEVVGVNYPVIRGVRSTALTNEIRAGVSVEHRTTGDMADGFGAGFSFDIRDSAGVSNPIGGVFGVRAGGDTTGDLYFQTYAANTPAYNMVIKSNGNVGINTTTPTAKLQIKGAGLTTGVNFQTLDSAGTALVTGLDNGNVGIGTTSPSYLLDINGTTRTKNLISENIIIAGSSTSILEARTGHNGYTNFSGGIGTGGADSVLGAQRITREGNLVNIGSIQAGQMNLTKGGTFVAKVDYGTGTNPASVALTDVNGDGKADMAVANYNSTSVSVFLNNGDGTFATKVDYTTGSGPWSVALADVNGDGKADMAVANQNSTSVSVFLNNGNGTFTAKVDYTTGINPASVALTDLNGDGKADMAVTNYNSTSVSVFLNNGDGTFATKVDYTTGSGPWSVALADVNGDGKADMAVTNSGSASVSIFLNNGDGTFATKVDYTTGTGPQGVAFTDVNGDGKADMAVANSNSTFVSVFLNNGDGTFATKVDYTTGSNPPNPRSVALTDINGDGKADMVVANYNSTSVSVFLNNGDGTFATKVDYTTGSGPWSVALADVNGDGKADMAVVNWDSTSVSVFINQSQSMFFAQASTGYIGLGTTTPTNLLSLSGQSAQTIWTERNTTTNTAGTNLTLRVGGATLSATDKNGGDLYLSGGTATGTGSSNLYFQTATANTTGTTDNTPSTKMTILGSGRVGIGTTSPSARLHTIATTEQLRLGYDTSNYFSTTIGSTGTTTFDAIGTGAGFTFSDLITASSGLTSTGTLTANGQVVLGDGGDDIAINSNDWDISSTGALSGITTIGMSGQLTSTLATGTSPFAVASTTVNTNLNADLLDGQHGSYYMTSATDNWVNTTGDTMTGSLTFSGVASDIVTGANEHFSIMPNGTGNVGIGTTSPSTKLSVNGNLAVHNGAEGSYSSTSGLNINSTISDAANYTFGFTVQGAYTAASNRGAYGMWMNPTLYGGSGVTGFYANLIANTTPGNIPLATAAYVAAMTKSGAGTVNTAYGLWVDTQTIGTDNYTIYANGTGKSYFGGNVGIGTTTPSYLLDINGTTRTKNLISENIIIAGSSTSILEAHTGHDGYTNFSGGIGTSGADSVLGAQRITREGNLVNIGSIQAGQMNLTKGGTFAAKVDYGTGTTPFGVALADVNGDGKADMAVANSGSTSVSVFINNGNGTFATKVDYTTGTSPYSVALADVNGDGKADIAVANNNSASVSVLLNNGNGTFAAKVDYTTGSSPRSVAFADLNGDGKADIVVANYSSTSVSILLNNGNGTFATKVDYTTGSAPTGVAFADLNGDGKADIVVANYSSTSVSILLNNGNGTFATKVDYTTGTSPYSVALADVNGDGKADIAVANNNSASVSVLLNNGNGTFATKVDYTTGTAPTGVAFADLNGDGKADIVVANYSSTSVSVFINQSQSMFFAQASTGNVGIGTTSPMAALDVVSSSAPVARFQRNTSSTNALMTVTNNLAVSTGSMVDGFGGFTNYMLMDSDAVENTVARINWVRNGADNSADLFFSTANAGSISERMRIDKSGNIGIGTSTPAYLLDITRSTDDYLASIYNSNTGSSAGGLFIRSNGTGNLLTLNSSGSDILTVSPVQASFNVPTSFTTSGDVSIAYDLVLTNQTATSIKTNSSLVIEAGESFESNSVTLKTYNAGEVIVDGGSTAAYPLHVYRGTDGNVAGFTDTNGTCAVNPTNTALVCSSDATMKKDVVSLSGIDALSAINRIRLVSFHWNGETATDPLHTGVIAQEVASVLPNLVSIGMDGKLAVNYLGLVPYALSAIQQQQLQITDFSTNLTNLNLKTDADITTLAGLQTSVDANFVTINGKFEALDSQVAITSNDIAMLKYQLADEKNVNEQLQAQIAEIKLQNQRYDALNEIIAILDPSSLVFKDSLGNLDLLDGKLEASEIVAGVMTIKVVDQNSPTIGQAVITKVSADANADGIDDATGSDGKTVAVETLAVDENSNIFITPEGDAGGRLWVEKQFDVATDSFSGFKIKCSNIQEKDIKVNWWIVEKREVISNP